MTSDLKTTRDEATDPVAVNAPVTPATLTPEETGYQENTELVSQAEQLLQKKTVVDDRLLKLEQNRSQVSTQVYTKVRQDYQNQMQDIHSALRGIKSSLDQDLLELGITLNRIQEHINYHQHLLEEATLRHTLGEFDETQFEEVKKTEQGLLGDLEKNWTRLEAIRKKYLGLFPEDLGVPSAPLSEPAKTRSRPAPKPDPATDPVFVETKSKKESPSAEKEKSAPTDEWDLSRENTVQEKVKPVLTGDYFGNPQPPANEAPLKSAQTAVQTPKSSSSRPKPPPKPQNTFQLLVKDKGDVVQTVLLDRPITIGRSPTNDVILKEGKVSRRHAQVQVVNEKCMLMDLESSNGTFVNEQKIQESEIHEADVIRIGTYHFSLKITPVKNS